MPDQNIPILLIGYNRLENIVNLVEEAKKWHSHKVYISIDGPKSADDMKTNILIREYLKNLDSNKNFEIWFNRNNIGLSRNITESISKVFEKESNLIILEDDIAINYNVYESMSDFLLSTDRNSIGLVGGFSALPPPPSFLRKWFSNKWRPTIRINVWAWGLNKYIWDLYERDLSKLDIENELKNSRTWKRLSIRQKSIWLGRFKKVSLNPDYTWDFQLQFMSFRYDLVNYLPRYRSIDNLGFNDNKSTNTKFRRPRSYLGTTDTRRITKISKNKFCNFVNIQLELLTDSVSLSRSLKNFLKLIS
jgi:hypothetical protein